MNRDQLVAGGVAGAAFVCSATHIYGVAVDSGNPWYVAAVHPLGLDGLVYIGMRAVANGRKVGWLATAYGVGMSLAFNAVSYAAVAMPTWVIAMSMPIALILGVLVVHGDSGHGHEAVDTDTVDTPEPVRGHVVQATVDTMDSIVTVDTVEDWMAGLSSRVDTDTPSVLPVPVVSPEPVSRPRPARVSAPSELDNDVAEAVAAGTVTPALKAELAAKHGVSTKTVSRRVDALKAKE